MSQFQICCLLPSSEDLSLQPQASGSRPPPTSSSTNHRDERGNTAQHLFGHRKDNPVHFSVDRLKNLQEIIYRLYQKFPVVPISLSASTLPSTTDEPSTSESSFFNGRPNQDEPKTVFSPTKGCTKKFQTSELKSSRRIQWTSPTTL